MKRRTPRLIGLAVAGALLIASCGNDDEAVDTTAAPTTTAGGGGETTTTAASTPTTESCGVLVAAVPEDFDAIDPHTGSGETPATWLSLMYETLVGVDKNAELVPGLAESWTISDDGLTYTFTIRSGVTFHNGRELTSEDVKFNLERIINPDTAAVSQAVLSIITSIEAPDPSTLVLTLAEPSGPLLNDLAQQGRVGIVAPEAFDASGQLTEQIGTGPFKFESYSAADRMVLTANESYWGGAPKLAGIEVRIIPDATTRLTALADGEIDFAWAVPAEDGQRLADEGKFTLQENRQNRANFFSINLNKAPFDDPRVREAMWLAVSRNDIADAGWNGAAVPTLQPFTEDSFWYIDTELPVDADLEAARALISEAGAEGTKVVITQWDALGSDTEAQIVASAWNEIGLDATIEKVDIGTLVTAAGEGNFDVVYLWVGLITDPNRPYSFFESDSSRNGLTGGLKDPAVDALVAQGRSETDPEARKAIYEQVLQTNLSTFAQYFTVRPFQFVGVGNDVTGYEQGAYYVNYQGGGMTTACVPE